MPPRQRQMAGSTPGACCFRRLVVPLCPKTARNRPRDNKLHPIDTVSCGTLSSPSRYIQAFRHSLICTRASPLPQPKTRDRTHLRVLILSRKPDDITEGVLPRRRRFPPPWTRTIPSRHALLSARGRACIRQDPLLASTSCKTGGRRAIVLRGACCSSLTFGWLARALLHQALAAIYLDELTRCCAPQRS